MAIDNLGATWGVTPMGTILESEGFSRSNSDIERAILNNIVSVEDVLSEIEHVGYVPGFYLLGTEDDADKFSLLSQGIRRGPLEKLLRRMVSFNIKKRREARDKGLSAVEQLRFSKVTAPYLGKPGPGQFAVLHVDASPQGQSATQFHYSLVLSDGDWIPQAGYQRVQVGGRGGGGRPSGTGRFGGFFRDEKLFSDGGFELGNIELIGGVGWTYIGLTAVAFAGWWKNR